MDSMPLQLHLSVPQAETPDHVVEQLAALARESSPTPARAGRLGLALATALGVLLLSVGGAWAVGVVDLPGLPDIDLRAPAEPEPRPTGPASSPPTSTPAPAPAPAPTPPGTAPPFPSPAPGRGTGPRTEDPSASRNDRGEEGRGEEERADPVQPPRAPQAPQPGEPGDPREPRQPDSSGRSDQAPRGPDNRNNEPPLVPERPDRPDRPDQGTPDELPVAPGTTTRDARAQGVGSRATELRDEELMVEEPRGRG